MNEKNINAIELKQELAKRAKDELLMLSDKDQLDLLQKKYGHLRQKKSFVNEK